MEERYRLVFRGEVLEGQHRAVVKQRLLAALKLKADAAEQLFSGKTIVLKRDTDTKTAARLQAVFKTAGARLRVLAVETSQSTAQDKPQAPVSESSGVPDAASPTTTLESSSAKKNAKGGLDLLPVGSDLLTQDERTVPATSKVSVDHISVAQAGGNLEIIADTPPPTMPDTSHLTVAEPGVNLLEKLVEKAVDQLIERIATDFELLDVGVPLADAVHAVEPEVDMERIQFDVAAVGSELSVPSKRTTPKAPDTAHITLE